MPSSVSAKLRSTPCGGRWRLGGRPWGWRGPWGRGRALRGAWGVLGTCRWGGAGHIEEALVLLVGLVQHGGELRNVFMVCLLTLFVESGMLAFPVLHQTELFTED